MDRRSHFAWVKFHLALVWTQIFTISSLVVKISKFWAKKLALRYLYEPPIIRNPAAMIRLHKTLFNYYKTREQMSLFRVGQHFALSTSKPQTGCDTIEHWHSVA